jgi:PKD repeat protein
VSTAANIAPTASFTFSCANLACTFDGSGSIDPDGTITSYTWNFGDNSTGQGISVSHSYAAAGTYTVTLTVIDDGGLSGAVSRNVSVTAAPGPRRGR